MSGAGTPSPDIPESKGREAKTPARDAARAARASKKGKKAR